jgi:hypothetical protein
MLADDETIEVSLRGSDAVRDWWEDCGSRVHVDFSGIRGRETGACGVFWIGDCDHGCEKRPSAGTCNQIKVVHQSAVWSIQFLKIFPTMPTTHSEIHSRFRSL